MTGRKALESGLRVMLQDWLDRLSDDQLAVLAGHWENVMDDAALFRADSWVIAEKAIARLHEGQPENGENVRHDQEREQETGDMGMKHHNPRRDPGEAEDGPQGRIRRQRLQTRANKRIRGNVSRMGRRDRNLAETEPASGPLQREGIWRAR